MGKTDFHLISFAVSHFLERSRPHSLAFSPYHDKIAQSNNPLSIQIYLAV